ncbi:TRAP transporter large permease subunit [Phreatobacter cathodiphilus]|uniref:TRAP transporter large permease subunit n=1 Tax=Phreatobacter cathodiphilus TaxID=1868589 RepID=UPI001FE49F25|nr:TRAP transporter large permease subunit [Phreatobacter cathodiphilus]
MHPAGFVLEWVEITFILIVLVAPIVADLDFGMGLSREETLIWFGILVAVNLQTSFISPPFGASLYYLKGICPPHVTIGTIYRGVTPFMMIQLIPLVIAMAWPPLILWLPKLMR